MKKLSLISVMVICLLLCFAPLSFCVSTHVTVLAFDTGSNILYGVTSDAGFVSINVSTGALTLLNSNVADIQVDGCGNAVDPTTHTFYGIKHSGGSDYILSISATGVVTQSPALHF